VSLRELIIRNRSYRRFHEDVPVAGETLRECVDCARLSASAANLQPLKYIISSTPETNARIFPNLAWAGYLRDWPGPSAGERPSAYIVILGNRKLSGFLEYDCGIAAQSILLAASEKGLGGCIIASVRRAEMKTVFSIPDDHELLVVIALGAPKEKVVIEAIEPAHGIMYWRDSEGVHHVPKRSLEEVIIG